MIKRKSHLNFKLSVDFIEQGKSIVAYAPALDISTVGKNKKEAQKRFEELVSVFFEELEESGNLAEVLQELGWKKWQKSWKPPKIDSSKPISFSLPVAA